MKNFFESKTTDEHLNSDLDYLAAAGETKMRFSESEINELQLRIKNKFSPGFSIGFFGIFLALIIVSVSVSALFIPLPSQKNNLITTAHSHKLYHEIGITTPDSKSSDEILNQVPPVLPRAENFVLKRKFVKEKDNIEEKRVEMQATIDPIKIQKITSGNNEIELRTNEIYNAPVYDVLGYKITNYDAYYFKSGNPFLVSSKESNSPESESKAWDTPEKSFTAISVLRDALTFLAKGKYGDCLLQLELLSELNTEDVNSIFYSGLCNHFLGRHALALDYFSKIEKQPNNVFHQEAAFYSALSYFKLENYNAARQIFSEIVSKKGFYAERALEYMK